MRARSHAIVPIDACPLFAPSMAGAIPAARALAGDLRGLGKPLDIGVTAMVMVSTWTCAAPVRSNSPRPASSPTPPRRTTSPASPIRRRRDRAPSAARRLRRNAGSVAAGRLSSGDRRRRGEARGLRGGGAKSAKKVADLFCAAAAFALRLARAHEVYAADSDAAAVRALPRAAAGAQGLRAVTAETRDLSPAALRRRIVWRRRRAVRSSPRRRRSAGARPRRERRPPCRRHFLQRRDLARDARILIDAGFRLGTVMAVDQFRFSPHVELAAVFRRPRAKPRARRLLG